MTKLAISGQHGFFLRKNLSAVGKRDFRLKYSFLLIADG